MTKLDLDDLEAKVNGGKRIRPTLIRRLQAEIASLRAENEILRRDNEYLLKINQNLQRELTRLETLHYP